MDIAVSKVGVIGAGVMGSVIAAHLANCGLKVLLLDVLPDELDANDREKGWTFESREWRCKRAVQAINKLRNARRPVFADKESLERIEVGNLDDDLERLAECDWILESIVEDLEVKIKLFQNIEKVRKPNSIVTTNTSGLPISSLAASMQPSMHTWFLGTHFFNPPDRTRLVEIIPAPETMPEVIDAVINLFRTVLQKIPLLVKDTPNFICNRIALSTIATAFHIVSKGEAVVEEIDALCGKNMARLSTAVFRTTDAVGLDTVRNVSRNLYKNAVADERRQDFVLPLFVEEMIRKGWLGDKTGRGFYARQDNSEMVLDVASVTYRPFKACELVCVDMAAKSEDPREKVKVLIEVGDRGSELAWRILSTDLCYAANRVGEIADTVVDIDKAMRLGYYWRLGPFECWDAIGVENVVNRLEREGREVPGIVQNLLKHGAKSFYKKENGQLYYYDFFDGGYRIVT